MPFVRKLTGADLPRLKDHYDRLDADDRYLRFGHHMGTDAVHGYLDGIDFGDTVLMGQVEGDAVHAMVEVVPLTDGWTRTGELALTVEKPWRGRGIGTELCRRALVLACNRRIREVAMICLTENVQMQRIAAKLDGRVLRRDGEVESRVILPRPSPWSLMQEAVITGGAALGTFVDQFAANRQPGPDSPANGAPDRPPAC